MSEAKQHLALVSMTNKDVYYLTNADAKELTDLLMGKDSAIGESFSFVLVEDAKSGAKITLAVKNISSVVIGGRRG